MKSFTKSMLIISISLLTLLSTTCEKNKDEPQGCDGAVNLVVSGSMSKNYCLNEVINDDLGENYSFTARLILDNEAVSIFIIVGDADTPPGTGKFNCGTETNAFIQMVIHDSPDEGFYNAQSGSITVTQLDNAGFKASFTVQAKELYTEKNISLTGNIKYNK
jgi:hypothetical protein